MGRTKKKLRALLERAGFGSVVLHAAQGHWRTDSRADVMRWEGQGVNAAGLQVSFGSWDTMTACVRRGIDITADGGAFFDVSAKAVD